MEDILLREIDRIGEMIQMIAHRLGLFGKKKPDYSISNVREEIGKASLDIDLDALLEKENPVCYLVEEKKFSDSVLFRSRRFEKSRYPQRSPLVS